MSLTFTALPVEEGDAFLLQDGDCNYLFDAGGSTIKIGKFLKKEKVKELKVAICSHNDSDHANGFKGLLDSKKNKEIKIQEIWLPGTWAKIIQFVIDNILNKKRWNIVDCALHHMGCDVICDSESNESDTGKNYVTAESINSHLSDFAYLYDKYITWSRITKPSHMKLMLDNIMDIAKLAYDDDRTIRWFKPLDRCVHNTIDYGFVALNSEEVLKIDKIDTVSVFITTLLLTIENECSLVFEYHKNDIPVVRFSADSDCTCSNQPYNNSIIITAPHHGSDNNANVYDIIKGKDINWVRTYHKAVQVGCLKFLEQKTRYCVKCSKHKKTCKISFDYQNGTWNYKCGRQCNC